MRYADVIVDLSAGAVDRVFSYAVPEGIRCIGNSALSLCPNLTEVILPSTVTVVEDYAFSEAASLQKVTVPSGVVYIGASAFSAFSAFFSRSRMAASAWSCRSRCSLNSL